MFTWIYGYKWALSENDICVLYIINWKDVQSTSVVNNVERSIVRPLWKNGLYKIKHHNHTYITVQKHAEQQDATDV